MQYGRWKGLSAKQRQKLDDEAKEARYKSMGTGGKVQEFLDKSRPYVDLYNIIASVAQAMPVPPGEPADMPITPTFSDEDNLRNSRDRFLRSRNQSINNSYEQTTMREELIRKLLKAASFAA